MDINIDNYLRLNIQDAIMVLISTILIVLFVKKFFWKHVQAYLEARAAHIQSELDQSALNLQASENLKVQYEEKMANVKSEAKEIISIAKDNATKEASEIVLKAKENATQLKNRAAFEIENEKAKVREQMKEEISEVAFMAAKKVIAKELDEQTQKKYVEDFIDKAGEGSWQD